MGIFNFPNTKQTQTTNKGGCLKRILTIAVIVLVVYFLMKSCGGGGVLDLGRRTSSESANTTNTTPTIPNNTGSTTTTYYDDLSWIVGTWSCEMGAYGTVFLKFEGDGTSGNCAEQHDGSTRYGTYQVDGNVLSYRLSGESIPKKISIEPGQKLLDECGSYYRKR